MSNSELTLTIPAMKINQREEDNQAIYITVVKAKDFISRTSERFAIDYYQRDGGKETGYQRNLSSIAVNKIKDFVLKETRFPLLPTSILVNSRTPLKFVKESNNFGKLTIDQTLYVIDGQHRFEAWKSMMSDNKLKLGYGDYEFPVVILSNFAEIQEIQQFYVINSRQKRIKTDLAQRNILRLAGNSKTERIVPEKSYWTLYATKIVDILNEQNENSIWKNKIILPNDSSDLKKIKVISQASFVSSLKPFFIGKDAIFIVKDKDKRPDLEKWASLIDDFWRLIKDIYPEAIENPHDYSLLKTVGVFSMHLMFVKTISQEDAKQSILKNNHVKLNVLTKVENYLKHAKKEKMKLDFWRSNANQFKKERGENAGAYSSSVGHNKIVSRIMLGY